MICKLSDWVNFFIASCKRRGLRPRTIDHYLWVNHLLMKDNINLESCGEVELFKFLDGVSNINSLTTYRVKAIVIKIILRFLKRDDLAGKIELPKLPDREETVKKKILKYEDVLKLIEGADNPQDRLLVELFYESGARRGEIYNLKIRDVQFDEYGAILWLTGKSGTRRRRVYSSVPDLKRQINDHPEKNNSEAKLFHYDKHGLSDHAPLTILMRVKKLGRKVLGKDIHPHMFRHTKATEDSRLFTDREMMILYGWKRPDMVGVYSHLSMKDVEDKDLVLHGLKSKEEILRPLVRVRKCPYCKEDNAPVAMFCHKCSRSLTRQDMTDKELKEWIMKMVREAK